MHTVGIQCFRFEDPMYIPKSFIIRVIGWEARTTPNLDRAGKFCAHSPMGRIDMMSTPSGDHPGSKLFTSQPPRPACNTFRTCILCMHPIFRIINFRSSTQPRIVVQTCRDRHLDLIAAAGVTWQPDFYCLQFSDPSISNQLTNSFELRPWIDGTLLTPHL